MSGHALVLAADSGGGGIVAIWGFGIVLGLLHLVGFWKTIEKGGESGAWALLFLTGCLAPVAFVPVTRLVGRPTWWVILLYVPFVNLVVLIILSLDLARSFGKHSFYGVGLWLLGFVVYPMLGFGPAAYQAPSAAIRS